MTRLRRRSAAALLACGLTVGVSSLPAQSALAAPTPPTPNVVGLGKGAAGPAVVALQNALNRVGVGVKEQGA